MDIKFIGWISHYNLDRTLDDIGYVDIKDMHTLIKDLSKEDREHLWYKIDKIVKKEIIDHKYKFSGEHHQYGKCGLPVFKVDDKYFYNMWSFRSWGGLMADCWNEIEETTKYCYMDFYMWPDRNESVLPEKELEYYNSKEELNE